MVFRKIVLAAAFVGLLSLGALAQNFDIDLVKSINQNESTFKNNFFDGVSQSVTVFNIAAPLGVLSAGVIRHDPQLQLQAAYMAGGYVLSAICHCYAKHQAHCAT